MYYTVILSMLKQKHLKHFNDCVYFPVYLNITFFFICLLSMAADRVFYLLWRYKFSFENKFK